MTEAAVKKPRARGKKGEQHGRPVVYPDRYELKYVAGVGEEPGYAGTPVTLALMTEWMGFTYDEAEAKAKGCEEPLFEDLDGKDVYAVNNVTNRPLYLSRVDDLEQEILQKKWRFNYEPIILGRTALVLNGQHQGAALFRACQRWAKEPHWRKNWPEQPTIDKLVCFGADEDDEVVNTMDTCKPRSLTDVLYRSQAIKAKFGKVSPSDLKALSRMADNGLRLIWWRTARLATAFAPTRTHAEAMDFIEKHPHFLRAVAHVWEEYHGQGESQADKNKAWKANNQHFGAGYAAALLFLMGASASDGDKYLKAVRQGTSSEKGLDWSNWDKATEFWTLFCSGAEDLEPVRAALGALADSTYGLGSRQEKEAVVVKGWNAFVGGGVIELEDLDLDDIYQEDEETGVRSVAKHKLPVVGGIDYQEREGEEADEAEQERVQLEQERIRQEKEDEMRAANPPKKGKVPPKPKKAESNGQE